MKEVTVQELAEMREKGEDIQLIDVREAHELEIANIGGEHIPLGTIPMNTEKINKDKKVVIYCRSGGRSGQAVHYLENALKADNIYNLKGGILAWADQIDPNITKY